MSARLSVIQGMATIEVVQIWIKTLDQSAAEKKKVRGPYLSSSRVKNLSLLLLLHPKEHLLMDAL